MDFQPNWYAVVVRSRQEKAAAAMLEALGVEKFLPLTAELRQWSDRKQLVESPLFPGYLFVNTDRSPGAMLRIRKVPGVVDFVGNQRGPLTIPACEIEGIRTVLTQGVPCAPHPYLAEGDRVRVVRGPLAGVEGRFIRSGAKDQLIISVEMIRRSVGLSVARQDLEPLVMPTITAHHLAPVPKLPHSTA